MLPGDPSLYYEAAGERGPLVVVLHGGPGPPHDYLRPEWDRLAEGARVVYYDQRGCGRSGAPRRTAGARTFSTSTGCSPWLDQPAAFFEAALPFLREVAPPARAAP